MMYNDNISVPFEDGIIPWPFEMSKWPFFTKFAGKFVKTS